MAEIPGWDLEEVARREDAFVALVDKSIAMVVRKVSLMSEAVLVAAAVEPVAPPPPPPPPVTPALPMEALGAIPVLWAGQVTAELLPFLGQTLTWSAAAVTASITEAFPSYDFPPVSDVFAEDYLAQAVNRLVGIGDTIWSNMRDQLVIGFSEGESISELAARLQSVSGITEPRAHVIARTEVISASNIGSITQAKISGLVGTKSWEATNDDRTRCTHKAADGQTVDLNGKFKLGGLADAQCGDVAASYLDVPGDPTGPPGEVIQCRCTIIYDLDLPEEEPVVTAAAQVHTGAMIAFRMTEPDARCLELEGFEDADELHTTSLYLGDAVNFTDEDREDILSIIAGMAGEYDPITTNTFALNIFNPHVPDPDTAIVLGVEGKDTGLVELQDLITQVITSEYDIAEQHKPWVPHITLAYSDDLMLAMSIVDRLGPVTFDRIRVAFGGDVYDMPLGQVLLAADVDFDEAKVKRDKKGKFAKKVGVPDPDVDTDAAAASSAPSVSKLTNAVIYGKYAEGATIATSTDGETKITYSKNKILEYKKVGSDWKLTNVHTKGAAYKEINAKNKTWYMGAGPDNEPAAALTSTPAAPTAASPPLGTVAVNLSPESLWANKDKWADGEVMMEADPLAGTVQPPFRFVAKRTPSGKAEIQLEVQNPNIAGGWANFGLLSGPDQIKAIKNSSQHNFTFLLKPPKAAMVSGPPSTVPAYTPPDPPAVFTVDGPEGAFKLAQEGKIPEGTIVATSTWQNYTQPYQRLVWSTPTHDTTPSFNVEFYDHSTGDYKFSHSYFSAKTLNNFYTDPLTKVTWGDQFKVEAGTPPVAVPLTALPNLSDVWHQRTKFPINTVLATGELHLGSVPLQMRIVTAKSIHGDTVLQWQSLANTGKWVGSVKLNTFEQYNETVTEPDAVWQTVTPQSADPTAANAGIPTVPSPLTSQMVNSSGPPGPVATGAPPAYVTNPHKAGMESTFSAMNVKWYSAAGDMLVALKAAQDKYPQYSLYQVLDVMDATTNTKTDPTPFTTKIKKHLAKKSGAEQAKTLWGSAAKFTAAKTGGGTPSSGTNSNTATPTITNPTPTYGSSAGKPASLADYPVLTPTQVAAMQTSMAKKYGAVTDSQHNALYTYTGSSYGVMNGCLRKPTTCTPNTIALNDRAAAGMRPTTKPIKVFRGAGWSSFGLGLTSNYGDNSANVAALQAKIGQNLKEPGFLSTSVSSTKAFSGELRLEVHVPPGVPASYLGSAKNSQHPNEKELLLAPGLEYRVVEVLPPNPSLGMYKTIVRLEVVVP